MTRPSQVTELIGRVACFASSEWPPYQFLACAVTLKGWTPPRMEKRADGHSQLPRAVKTVRGWGA